MNQHSDSEQLDEDGRPDVTGDGRLVFADKEAVNIETVPTPNGVKLPPFVEDDTTKLGVVVEMLNKGI